MICSLFHLAGSVCMLKTGVKDGPNKGKSFYVCVDKQSCDFSQQARYPHLIYGLIFWTVESHKMHNSRILKRRDR